MNLINDYLKIDDDIYKVKEYNEIYKNISIYIIHYPKGKDAKYSFDTISEIDKENNIYHCCAIDNGSSGAPILNLNTFQVIGIHIGYISEIQSNIGKIIKYPIDDFNKTIIQFNNKKREGKIYNEIILKLEIGKKDINKEIYFLDNVDYIDYKTKKKYFHDNLKELNETNTKIYINGKEYKYNKYFIPNKEGI